GRMTHVYSTSLCRLAAALAAIATIFLTSVPEIMGQVADQQTSSPGRTTQEQQAASPQEPAQEATAQRWHGPLFMLMDKLTQNANDTGSETPPNKARFEIDDYYQKKAQS